MSKEAEGRIYPKMKGKKKLNSAIVYIPSGIVEDSTFPLPKEKGAKVEVIIENDAVVLKNPTKRG